MQQQAAAVPGATGHAVVIGAGMAGLAAARVLADRFERVTVVDRDRLPPGPDSRRGVPQSAHPHALLAVGREALEQLFPGLTGELVERGARWVDVARDAVVWQLDGYRTRAESGVRMLAMSRPLLESCVRRRLRAVPRVAVLEETAVAGLTGRPGERVTGVALADGRTLAADLVADASGRGSRSDRWLRDLGFPPPPESVITVRVHYTTRLVRGRPAGLSGPGLVVVAESPPQHRRYGAAFSVEGGRWLVTLGGFHGAQAPTDPAGFQRFAESLPQPVIAELLRDAEPLSDPVAYTYPASRRRHFERLRRIPAGYVALGDALCSFNPVYGHGITVAAQEAVALAGCLDRHRGAGVAMARDFYRRTGRLITVAWRMAASTDFAYPGTAGPRPRALALTHWYQRKIFRAAQVSPEVVRTLVRVQHLLAPGSALLRPAMVVKVLRGARRARRTAPAHPAIPAPR
ncbi:FAD-binding monooxygenase [Amorphoplanes nipponensis]|uniref:FAD-binding monooxygenase n=1 Tax=Actinoplanes nipponensis TaxID=135950 RepID=A0A919MJE7_9ACTN|nr:FAD-dependent oxidoreductase [Actinoplanes nipponensis]GIE51739.1 FAD-binding monooxygenase [Actinoplanes nipponensis]